MTRLEAKDRQGLPAATKNWEKVREDPPSPAAKTSEGAGPALISRFWPAEPQEGPHLFVSDHPVWCFVMAQRTHSHAPPPMSNRGQRRKTRRKCSRHIKPRLGRDQGGDRKECFLSVFLSPGTGSRGPSG